MKILFLLKNSGVEKTTVFIEVIKMLVDRGTDINIIVANRPQNYVEESYYIDEPAVRECILNITENKASYSSRLKSFIRKYKVMEKITWTIYNFILQWGLWIRVKANRNNDETVLEEFLTPSMRNFKPKEYYDYIWTVDEFGLLWAEWINLHSETKYKIVHHSLELRWEHYFLQAHKSWQYIKQSFMYEKACTILKKTEIDIIQDESRWKILCRYTGLDENSEKILFPVSIKDYQSELVITSYKKKNINADKKIVFYPTRIGSNRGCAELINMSKELDENFVTVIHGSAGDQDYISKIQNDVLSSSNVIISNTTLDYNELINIHQDVWCVFLYYSEIDYNNKYIVNSSNKLVMALQAGKPIITLGNKTLADLCAEYGCGIAINSWSEKEFAVAVNDMEKNYDFYCKNARRCYEERFNIELYAEELYNKLLSKI